MNRAAHFLFAIIFVALAMPSGLLADDVVLALFKPPTLPVPADVFAAASSADDYGRVAVVHVPAAAADAVTSALAGSGIVVHAFPEFNEINLRGFTITGLDPAAPNVPAGQFLTDYSGATGLYLLQFRAFARQDWLDAVAALGGRVIQYFPENTYLIAIDPQSRKSLMTVPGYRHAVVYQPAYKLDEAVTDHLLHDSVSTQLEVVVQLDGQQDVSAAQARMETRAFSEVSYARVGPYLDAQAVLTLADVQSLLMDPGVVWIEPATSPQPSDERDCQIVAGHHNTTQATNPAAYVSYLNGLCGHCLQDLSSYTANVTDTGLDQGPSLPVHADFGTRVTSWQDYCGTNPESKPSHGELVAGLIAGNPQGTGSTVKDDLGFYYGTGIAPTAHLRISRIFNEFEFICSFTPAKYMSITADGYNAGARFQNQSWNMPTIYTYSTYAQAADYLVRDAYGTNTAVRPMFITIATGNLPNSNGTHWVTAPSNAKNIVAMGGTTELRAPGTCPDPSEALSHIAALSPRDVMNDTYRYKPDFVAPATRIVSAQTNNPAANLTGICPDQDPAGLVSGTNNHYAYGAGTSFSTPQATGLAILFSRYYKNSLGLNKGVDPSPAMIKAMMLIGAENMTTGGWDDFTNAALNYGTYPRVQGWGRLGFARLFDGTHSISYDEDHAVTPTRRFTATGQSYTFTFPRSDVTKPVRIALAYTDPAAAVNASAERVNNLVMVAMKAGTAWWCDNDQMDINGYTPAVGGCDPFAQESNNLRFINISPNSFSGTFTVEVDALGISAKSVPGLDAGFNQDFALWVYNAQ